MASREAAHSEDSSWGSDAVHPPALRLPGGQKWRCEEEGSGRFTHFHDAPELRKDEQGNWETQGTQTFLP